MPSTILSDNGVSSGTSGIKTTGSNDGALALQTTTAGGTATTAISIDTSQNVTFAGAVTNPAGTAAAPSITFTGDTNTGIFSPGADITAFTTGGTERGRFTAGGYLKASPDGTYTGSTGSYHELRQSANTVTVEIRATNASFTGDIAYVAADRNTTNNTFQAFGYYNYGASAWRFRVADSGAISTAGSIQIGDAGVPPTSGIGVKFPATQSASSDANTLDDYEEGTWTPTVGGATTHGSATYNAQIGRYTKIGNVVTVYAYMDWSSGTGSGTFLLTSLPFATQNVSSGYQAATIGYFHNIGLTANNVPSIFSEPNTTYLYIYQYPVGGGASTAVTYDSAGGLIYSFTYLTN